ncbi:MAG: polyketide synthase dehydratase domain-containing protein, partial [Microcystaceae cyanobacterium]
LAPKVHGARNLLSAINPEQLRLFITFGSIIARTGLPGEADYALANEWLSRLTEQFQAQHPHCHCLNLDWSVWSGIGMGERLGSVEALMREGITPIPPDAGISILRRLIAQSLPVTSVVVTGRFGEPPTLKVEQPELPLWRFLEEPRVYYPGVELVVDVTLSTDTDPYLNDHVFQGERIFPGVMGLEAMAQVVMALLGTSEPPIFENVQFNRPVVVPEHSFLKIRLAALVQESGQVEVVLRSEQTGFSTDHFRAVCLKPEVIHTLGAQTLRPRILKIRNSVNPQQDLYGDLLFHKGRFQRLRGYHHLRATECIAEIALDRVTPWFSRYLPDQLILGDPGARDAVIHGLQACVPHGTLLPIGIERLVINQLVSAETFFVSAKERERLGDVFIYDLEVINPDGAISEQWQGLKLQMIQPRDTQLPWVASLLTPYLERRIQEFIPNPDLTVVIDKDGTVNRRVRSDRTLQALTSPPTSFLQSEGSNSLSIAVTRRPDGKPEVSNGKAVSVSHAGDLTLAVAGSETIGCDVEPVVSRLVEVWGDLLGEERIALAFAIASQIQESLDLAATRVWCASECLKKAGAMINTPLVLVNSTSDGVVWIAAGENAAIATFGLLVQEFEQPLAIAVLVRREMRNS